MEISLRLLIETARLAGIELDETRAERLLPLRRSLGARLAGVSQALPREAEPPATRLDLPPA